MSMWAALGGPKQHARYAHVIAVFELSRDFWRHIGSNSLSKPSRGGDGGHGPVPRRRWLTSSTASMIPWYPVHLQMFPAKRSRTVSYVR